MDLYLVPLTIGLLVVVGGVSFVVAIGALRDPTDVVHRLRGAALAKTVEVTAERSSGGIGRHLGPLAKLVGANQAEVSRLRAQLSHAGYRGEHAVQAFLASKVLLATVALVTLAFLNTFRADPLPHVLVLAVFALGLAFFLPNLWLRSRAATRQGDIERALPDALDLLVTCVEAGLALDAAFQRVATELARAWPVLAEEMNLTYLEVKAGVVRAEAMRRLADRTGVMDLRSLSATLNQTEMFGTSVSSALRVQAEGMRIKRSQRAEEKAAFLAVKMTLPLAFCFLPCLFSVILGPAAINIMNTLLKR